MPNDQERRDIGARVERARLDHAWPKERAAHEAGVSPITWTRVENGEPVRADSLAKVLGYIRAFEGETPMALMEATDEQLLTELARRLDLATRSGTPHALIETRRAPQVQAEQSGDTMRVSARPARSRQPNGTNNG